MITFTTPGAAIDWMLEKPEKRKVECRNFSYRLNPKLENRLECRCRDDAQWSDALSFFSYTHFEGHEEPEEKTLEERCADWMQNHFGHVATLPTTAGRELAAIIAEARK